MLAPPGGAPPFAAAAALPSSLLILSRPNEANLPPKPWAAPASLLSHWGTWLGPACAALPNEEKVQTAGGRGQEPTTPVLPEHMVGVIYYVTYAAEGLARRDARYTGAGGSADAAPDDESD